LLADNRAATRRVDEAELGVSGTTTALTCGLLLRLGLGGFIDGILLTR
jgi:uncharacterized membrane protein